MRKLTCALIALAALLVEPASAQVPVQAAHDQDKLLASSDAKVAANKRLVYDFWREVFEGGHMEFAEKYMAETYIQHNPMVPTGRAAFMEFFSKVAKPKPIEPKIKGPLVNIVGEGDYVVLSFAREYPEPSDPSKKYTSTWFDMFRIENGRIAEHWDNAVKR